MSCWLAKSGRFNDYDLTMRSLTLHRMLRMGTDNKVLHDAEHAKTKLVMTMSYSPSKMQTRLPSLLQIASEPLKYQPAISYIILFVIAQNCQNCTGTDSAIYYQYTSTFDIRPASLTSSSIFMLARSKTYLASSRTTSNEKG